MRPPRRFSKGDQVICMTEKWSTLRYGCLYIVAGGHRTNGTEYIIIDHPKFGRSVYNAGYFELAPKEINSMYVAINLKNDNLEDLTVYDLMNTSRMMGADKSLDVLKTLIRQHIAKNPDDKVAIFTLHSIAEVQVAPVLFRNMRV